MNEKIALETMTLAFRLNGVETELSVPPDMSLTALLRDELAQTETKKGCEIGRCGACMVLMEGVAVNSCLLMAWQVEGREIVTASGLGQLPEATIVRDALAEESAFQCGYCAPGFVMSLIGLFRENPDAGKDDIMTALEGNLCRCTGYQSILRGALLAASRINSKADDDT